MAKGKTPSTKDTIVEKVGRKFRPLPERLAEIDKKIKFHQDTIDRLNTKKAKMIKNATNEKEQIKTLKEKLEAKGMSIEDLLKKIDETPVTIVSE